MQSAEEEIRQQIKAAGGLDLIVRAVKHHFEHPEVGEQGCAALANLCWGEIQKQEVQAAGGTACIFADGLFPGARENCNQRQQM